MFLEFLCSDKRDCNVNSHSASHLCVSSRDVATDSVAKIAFDRLSNKIKCMLICLLRSYLVTKYRSQSMHLHQCNCNRDERFECTTPPDARENDHTDYDEVLIFPDSTFLSFLMLQTSCSPFLSPFCFSS